MKGKGRWELQWQNYPTTLVGALMAASEAPYVATFKESRAAQSFKVRMQKLGKGVLADPESPDWLRKAAENVAWGIVRQTSEGYTVTGQVRKPRYLTVEELEREMIAANR